MEMYSLMIDFAMLVLIWMVQLLIYPGFLYFAPMNLKKWHPGYTRNMSFIVMPLMLVQLILHIYSFITSFSYSGVAVIVLLMSVWLLTFLIFVPLHQKIGERENILLILRNLVKWNWWRTGIWTLIFLLNFLFQ